MAGTRVERIFALAGLTIETSSTERDNSFLLASFSKSRAALVEGVDPIELSQWLPLSQTLSSGDLATINSHLTTRSYLVGNKLTLADLAIFEAISSLDSAVSGFTDLQRWLEHVSHRTGTQKYSFPKVPTLLQFAVEDSPVVHAPASSAPATATAPPASSAPASDAKTVDAGEVKEKKDAKEGKEGKEKKEKKPKAEKSEVAAPAAAAPEEEELDPSKLDIRVGVVVKCWNHPDSEKLLCEEIDAGEGAVRSIGSGIRSNYTAEELQGKKVLILANLKERALAGFKSQGMVLCACNDDHSVIRIVEPPASAQPGDRVTFAGFSGEPASSSQMAKKKYLEKLGPLLRTNGSGVATWNSIPFTIRGEPCVTPLLEAQIS